LRDESRSWLKKAEIIEGSRFDAVGSPKKYSDIDLILVSKKFRGQSFLKRSLGLHFYWKLEYPVDILLFNTEEFERLKGEVSIVSEALREGIEI
jgi:predicted nucleotidyltransferase